MRPINLRKTFEPRILLLVFLLGTFSPIEASSGEAAPLTPQQVFLKATDDLTAMRWGRAEAGFKKVLKDDPDNLKAHFCLGRAEFYSRHLAEAQAYFEWVNSRDPDVPINHYYLGRVNYQLENFVQARSEMEAADHLDSQIAMVHYYLGLIHYKQKDIPGSQSELAEATVLDPTSAKAHYALAYLLSRDLHKSREALQEVNNGLSGRPDAKWTERFLKLKKEIKK